MRVWVFSGDVKGRVMDSTELDEDRRLAAENIERALRRLTEAPSGGLSGEQVGELRSVLTSLFREALPCFVEGARGNPVHHNTQVLDNMIQIGLGEGIGYRELKISAVAGLLHDIGNATSERGKVKTDQVEDAWKAGDVAGARQLAADAIAFRLEHMDNGPELIRQVAGALGHDDLHFICRAVLVHDYPSIEEILSDLRNEIGVETAYAPGDFLLPLDGTVFGRLIERLREADRLFMVTEQGVLKDLRDDGEEATAENVLRKLRSNARRHEKEFVLYECVGRGEGFRGGTLYRTATGYSMYLGFQDLVQDKWAGRV